jgi:predicted dehydrogenase
MRLSAEQRSTRKNRRGRKDRKMLKYALTGAGYAGHYHVKALKEMGCLVAGITNRTEEHGVELANEADTQYYKNTEALLKNSGPDILIVAVATEKHLEEITTAIDCGIRYIFCEKPAGVNVREARKIKEICEKAGTMLGVGYKMRYESIFLKAKKMVEEGKIGRIATMTFNFYQTVPHSRWFLDHGFISETMAHPIDLANWFAGADPQSLLCNANILLGGAKEDRASVVLNYPGGLTVNINGGWIADYPYIAGRKNICFEIIGSGGYLCGVRPNNLYICDEEGLREVELDIVDPIKKEIQDFEDCVLNSRKPGIGIDDAILVQKVIEAASAASAAGSRNPV